MRNLTVPAALLVLAAVPGRAFVRPNPLDSGVRRLPVPEAAPPASAPLPVQEAAPAPVAPASPNTGALAALQQAARSPFEAQWNPATGVARLLAAGRSRAYAGAPADAARAFLTDAEPLFGAQAAPDALGQPTVTTHALGTQVTFPQEVNGVPVLGHAVTVNLNDAGEAILAENATVPLAGVNTAPAVSAVRAAALARGTVTQLPSLAIEATGRSPRLVWRFTETGEDQIPVRVTVDARTGAPLKRVPLVHFANGTGLVYRGNPVSTPTRENLTFTSLDGFGKLTGTYARISKYAVTGTTFTPQQTAINTSLLFNFNPESDMLSQAQAYYGISSIHDWYKDHFGFTKRDQQIPGYVRWPSLANAYYSPDTSIGGIPTPNGYMVFGYGSDAGYPTRDFALDTDVLYHEYTHAVMDKLSPQFSAASFDDMERGGIGEGVADYFSSTILNDPVLGEYTGQAFGATSIRDLRGRKHYPEEVLIQGNISLNGVTYSNVRVYPEEHQTGEIWGPALWDLRTVLGQEKADTLIFNGMALLNSTTTFQSALGAILTADDTLYAGADKTQIRDVFSKRGITDDVFPILYLPEDAFYSDTGVSKVLIGLAYKGSDGYAYIYPYDTFPTYNVGENYLFSGYVDDPTVKTVAFVLRNSSNAVVAKVTAPVKTMTAYDSNGNSGTFYYFTRSASFPTNLIPAGQKALTGLKLSVQSYTQAQSVVETSFSSLTPKATAPASGTTFAAQLIVPQVTPAILPPGFGDTDGNGKADVTDALLLLRALNGRGTLTTEQKVRADIAAPQDGNPNIADVRMILQRAGGLL